MSPAIWKVIAAVLSIALAGVGLWQGVDLKGMVCGDQSALSVEPSQE